MRVGNKCIFYYNSIVKRYLLIFLSSLFFLSAGDVSAIEQIHSFQSDVHIDQDALVTVSESIEYEFPESRHGLLRKIPVVAKNKDGRRYEIDFNFISATDESGVPYQYTVTRDGDYVEIKVGDPKKYVTGIKNYVLTYTFKGVITYFSDHDELYLNITGNEWKIPILDVESHFSADFYGDTFISEVTDYTCYTGAKESTSQECYMQLTGSNLVVESARTLYSGEGITAVLSFPKGLVTIYEPRELADYSWFWSIVVKIYLVVGYIIVPILLWWLWYTRGRDPQVGPVVRVFDPPKDKDGRVLTPIEVGALVDEVIHPRDISAEIIYLAINKYIKIKEHPKKLGGLVKGEIKFLQGEKIADLSKLTSGQQKLIKALGLDTKGQVKLSSLGATFSKEIVDLKDSLYKSMVSGGFFPENPDSVRKMYLVLGFISLVIINVPLAVMLFVFSRFMSRRTLFGAEAKRWGMGLKQFLSSQERQYKFQEENYYLFEKLLPYAIVFGAARIWAKKFEGLGKFKPDWYIGTTNTSYVPYVFTQRLESNLSRIQSSYTPTRASSTSGFSSGFSGGSSGGGFGGGGGGSW